MIGRFERFSVFISDISRYWHKISAKEMEKHGLKAVHSIYLTTMAQYPQGMTAPQICELCGKDKSDVSRMMRILDKKGLVVKEGGYQNQYNGLYRLTEEGMAVAEEVRGRASLAVELSGRDLTDETRAVMYRALESIAGNLRDISEKGLPDEE